MQPGPYYTTPHPAEAGCSVNNLPTVLFQLEPPVAWGDMDLQQDRNEVGEEIRGTNRRLVKKFPMLPDQISVAVEDYRLVMYTDRYDPRIVMGDIRRRMHGTQAIRLPTESSLNCRKLRYRNKLNLSCWARRQPNSAGIRDCLLVDELSEDQIMENTVLPVTREGLHMPMTGDNTSSPNILPRGYFLQGGRQHEPSEWLEKTIRQVKWLRERASQCGYAHWIFLPNLLKPLYWLQKCRQHTTPELKDIRIPRELEIPSRALASLRACIEMAVAEGSLYVPPVNLLPEFSRNWVARCIQKGEDARNPAPLTNPNTVGALFAPAEANEVTSVSPIWEEIYTYDPDQHSGDTDDESSEFDTTTDREMEQMINSPALGNPNDEHKRVPYGSQYISLADIERFPQDASSYESPYPQLPLLEGDLNPDLIDEDNLASGGVPPGGSFNPGNFNPGNFDDWLLSLKDNGQLRRPPFYNGTLTLPSFDSKQVLQLPDATGAEIEQDNQISGERLFDKDAVEMDFSNALGLTQFNNQMTDDMLFAGDAKGEDLKVVDWSQWLDDELL